MKRFLASRSTPKKRPNLNLNITSLMWPDEKPVNITNDKPNHWHNDLGLMELVDAMAFDRNYRSFIYHTLSALVTDATVINWRQAVLDDFVSNPRLVMNIEILLTKLHSLGQNNNLLGKRQRSPLQQTSERLAELEVYIDSVQQLYDALQNAALRSKALTSLRSNLANMLNDEDFKALQQQLPTLRKPLEKITSLTIGINLDVQMRPESAVLLTINDYQVGGSASFLDRVIGPGNDDVGESGVAPLNYLPKDPELRPFAPLFQDLEKLMTHIAKPVAEELARYTRISSQPLNHLEFELAFYLSAMKLMNRLQQKGINFCKPQILPLDQRVMVINGLVNVNLCLREKSGWVASDVGFDDDGRIAILTGPNSGGKTTYLQAVGLAQALFQAGLFIPAQQAKMSPVDAILTHFPALETRQQGRLAEEAERLRHLFQQMSHHSLILLNETFSSTSSGEANYLAQDMLCGLRVIGGRAIFATHLVELADHLEEMQNLVDGSSDLFSLVAGVHMDENGETVRTFEIKRGMPLGRSYAREIAERHGISLSQILTNRQDKSSD